MDEEDIEWISDEASKVTPSVGTGSTNAEQSGSNFEDDVVHVEYNPNFAQRAQGQFQNAFEFSLIPSGASEKIDLTFDPNTHQPPPSDAISSSQENASNTTQSPSHIQFDIQPQRSTSENQPAQSESSGQPLTTAVAECNFTMTMTATGSQDANPIEFTAGSHTQGLSFQPPQEKPAETTLIVSGSTDPTPLQFDAGSQPPPPFEPTHEMVLNPAPIQEKIDVVFDPDSKPPAPFEDAILACSYREKFHYIPDVDRIIDTQSLINQAVAQIDKERESAPSPFSPSWSVSERFRDDRDPSISISESVKDFKDDKTYDPIASELNNHVLDERTPEPTREYVPVTIETSITSVVPNDSQEVKMPVTDKDKFTSQIVNEEQPRVQGPVEEVEPEWIPLKAQEPAPEPIKEQEPEWTTAKKEPVLFPKPVEETEPTTASTKEPEPSPISAAPKEPSPEWIPVKEDQPVPAPVKQTTPPKEPVSTSDHVEQPSSLSSSNVPHHTEENDNEIEWIPVQPEGDGKDIIVEPAVPAVEGKEIHVGPAEQSQEECVLKKEVTTDTKPPSVERPKDYNSDSSMSFDIDEYERRMSQKTSEMKALVDKLFEKNDAANSNNEALARRVSEVTQNEPQPRRVSFQPSTFGPISGGLPANIESVVLGKGIVKELTGVVILPSGDVLATDAQEGILIFSIDGNVVKQVKKDEWKKPAAPCYHRNYVLVIQSIKNGEGQWERAICKFSLDLELLGKIECPQWIKDRDVAVISERLTVSAVENIYLAVNGDTFTGLYELTPLGMWTEIDYKLDERFTDIVAFSIIPPITQLLVIEGRKNYVMLYSIRDSKLAGRKKMGVVERPGAMSIDEAGHLFVLNRASASILTVDTLSWCASKAVCVVDSMITHFCSSRGLLAVPMKDCIRVQKYEFR